MAPKTRSKARDETENKESRAPLGSIPVPNPEVLAKMESPQAELGKPQDDAPVLRKRATPAQLPERGTLPSLPREVLRRILTFTDTGSLARCGQVTQEWFEISTDVLYHSIELDDVARLGELFRCLPEQATPSLLAPQLKLKIQSLTFHLPPDPIKQRLIPLLVLPAQLNPLHLLRLRILVTSNYHVVEKGNQLLFHRLLLLVNPCFFDFGSPYPLPPGRYRCLGFSVHNFPTWNRLQEVSLKDAVFIPSLRTDQFNSPMWTASFAVSFVDNEQLIEYTIEDLTEESGFPAFPSGRVQLAELWLQSNAEAVDAMWAVQRALVATGMTVEEKQQRMRQISFIVGDNSL